MVNKINNLIHSYETYNPSEFMPVMRDGRLDNRREFIKYKLERILSRLPSPVR